MFTGIIEETGFVRQICTEPRSTELLVYAPKTTRRLKPGDSVAVNGACLTVISARNSLLRFDVLNETLRRTNLGSISRGGLVNLERALRANARLDGHFVLGHVDATGVVKGFEKVGQDYVLDVKAPAAVMKYIVEKGSVAIDGISLTVAGVGRDWFRAWIIPYTRAVTNLSARRAGDRVNLEADILGKYAEKLLRWRRG